MSQKTAAASRSVVLASDHPGIPNASNVILSDGSAINMVGTTQSKFTDNFLYGSNTFDPSKWSIVRNANGITITTSATGTTVNIPTTAGAELLLVGLDDTTVPANLSAVLTLAVRTTTTDVRIGYLAVDANNNPIAHSSLTGDFAHRVNVNYANASPTTMILESVANNLATVKQITFSNQVTTVTPHELALEFRPEDVTASSATPDSTAIRAAGGRISSVIPDAALKFRPFIWIKNNATSTAASLVLTRFVNMDIQELQAEIGGGRGNFTASQAVPATLVGGSFSQPVTGTVTANIGNIVANTTANGITITKLISAATTNATLVKASAGKIIGGVISNLTASWKYVKFFNKATAPVPGTDTPVFTLAVPPNQSQGIATIFDQFGMSFSTGIGYAITGAVADLDTTAVAAGDVLLNLAYV